MPKQVQNPNVSRQLVEQFGIVGRMRPALDEVIVPVVTVANLGAGAPPPVTRRASAFVEAPAVVGEIAVIELRVPAGIGAYVDRLAFASGAATAIKARFRADGTIAPFGNTATATFTDSRVPGVPAARWRSPTTTTCP